MDKSMMPNADSTYELPQGGIAGLGAVLLRAAERIGTVTVTEAARQAMMGLTLSFANAERQGSVCVRALDAVKGLMPDAAEAAEGPEEAEMHLAQAFDVLKTGLKDLQALGLAQNFQDFISAAGTRLGKTSDETAPTQPIAPLIVDEAPTFAQTRIYFARLALEELLLARTLARFAAADEAFSVSESGQPDDALIAEVTGRAHADEQQRLAVSTALKRRLMVVSGGPGTGKTTTVAQILECLLRKNPTLRIALAAPTGKATGRMQQSLESSANNAAKGLSALQAVLQHDAFLLDAEKQIRSRTIHKWLASPTAAGSAPGIGNPIPADVLVVDEASMVDIHLAVRLMRAVSPEARVILLGDKHQLAAVGPGAVFAEISDGKGALARMGAVVELVKSWRFGKDTPIGQLAAAINHQGANAGLPEAEVFQNVLAAFASAGANADKSLQSASLHTAGLMELQKGVFTLKATDEQKREREIFSRTGLTAPVRSWLNRELEGYASVLSECRAVYLAGTTKEQWESLRQKLWLCLSGFRALAAQRHGAMSVQAVNDYADQRIRSVWPLSEGAFGGGHYPGEVIIVRRNDEGLGVHNGDVGIVLPKLLELDTPTSDLEDSSAVVGDEDAGDSPERQDRPDRQGPAVSFTVYFGDTNLELPVALLPQFDVAWAMTIHQSQGSEFERVAVLLPVKRTSELATRELLYTAVTRTKRTVDVFGSEAVLRRAVEKPTVRDGSLGRRLELFCEIN